MRSISNISRARRTWALAAAAIVVAAGLFQTLRASVPQVATGTWVAAPAFGDIPIGAAAAVLADGRLIVAGGRASDGTPLAEVNIYDATAGTWQRAGQLTRARSALAVAALEDGRVLIAGGRTSDAVTSSIEIYDPATGESREVGVMTLPRANHAAAALKDGRVLIAGGTDGSAPLATAELFDPQTNTSAPTSGLRVARRDLSATMLLDGHVLIAGGNDGTNDLAMAEIYDAALNTFYETEWMNQPRSGHVAIRLPNSNTVLVAGGRSNGTMLKSAEQYAHWSESWLRFDPEMAVGRIGAIAAPTTADNVVTVGGGGDSSAEYYGYATVKTDKDDYAPGETVTITGSGWQPGETVQLKISEDADTHYDFLYQATADEQGNIVNTEFYPRDDETFHHIGVRFYLSATGAASQAQSTFTDAVNLQSVSVGAQTPGAVNSGISATYNPVTIGLNGNGNTGCTITLSVSGLPTGATAVWGTNPVTSTGANKTTTLRIDTTGTGPARTPEGTHTFTVQASAPGVSGGQGCNGGTVSTSATLIVDNTAPTVTIDQAAAQADPAITSPIDFTVAFSEAVSGFANADVALSGTAGATTAVVTGGPTTYNVAVSGMSGSGTVVASIAAGAAQDAAGNLSTASTSTDNTVTFTPCTAASVTTQPTSQTVTYGQNATFTAAAGGTPTPTVQWQVKVGDAAFTDVPGETSTTLTVTKPPVSATGNQYRAVFTNTCSGTQIVNSNPATLTVNAKLITVTPNGGQSKVFGASDPTLTFTSNPALESGDSFTGALGRAAGEDVGTYAITLGTLSAGSNYSLSLGGTVTFAVTPKPVAIMPDAGQSKVFGASDPTLTFTNDGGLAAGAFTGALSRVAGEDVGTYAITLGTLTAGDNYSLSLTGAVTFAVMPKPVVITPDAGQSKVFGAADPTLTFTPSAALEEGDSFSGAPDRAIGENVGFYGIGLGTLSAGSNYTLSLAATVVNFEITRRTISVKADDQSKTYGDADPTLTYSITSGSLVGTDTFGGALTRAAGESVGHYAINQGTLALSTNYTLNFTAGDFEITRRPITVTADPKSKILGATDPPLTYEVSGTLVLGDAFSGALTRAAGEAVGTYPIQQGTLTLGGNYNISFVSNNLTISYGVCLLYDNTKSHKKGSTVPIKLYLCNVSGGDVSAAGIGVQATTLTYEGSGASPLVEDSGNANADNNFRFDATLGPSGGYIFNLSTKGFGTSGTYKLYFSVNESSPTYWVAFMVR